LECWFYGKKGHIKKDFWLRKGDVKEGNEYKSNNQEFNIVGEIIHDALILSLDINNDYWVIDYCASFHVTSHKEDFIDYVPSYYEHAL